MGLLNNNKNTIASDKKLTNKLDAAMINGKLKIGDGKGKFVDLPYEHMDFGAALFAIKNGEAVARKGWNGKGMFIYYVGPGNYLPCTEIAKKLVNKDGFVPYAPYIAMKTVDGTVVPWLASQTDILAEDWEVVEI